MMTVGTLATRARAANYRSDVQRAPSYVLSTPTTVVWTRAFVTTRLRARAGI